MYHLVIVNLFDLVTGTAEWPAAAGSRRRMARLSGFPVLLLLVALVASAAESAELAVQSCSTESSSRSLNSDTPAEPLPSAMTGAALGAWCGTWRCASRS